MKVPYNRPEQLSDPYRDFDHHTLEQLIAMPDDHLTWQHYQMLFQVGLPAGTYEESCYFLPLALAYMHAHPGESFNCHSEVVWFLSEYAQSLAQDGLLAPALQEIEAAMAHWMRHFTIVHYTRDACQKKMEKSVLQYCRK